MTKFHGILLENISLTEDVRLVRLCTLEHIVYRAGQFALVEIPTSRGEVQRAFSFVTAPCGKNEIEFLVKLVAGGAASEFFRTALPGTPVTFSAPMGNLTLPDDSQENITFVATGVGLAPFCAMLEEMEQRAISSPTQPSPFTEGGGKSESKIRFLFGCRSEEDIFFADRLERFAKTIPNFSHEICLSKASADWRGVSGRVTDMLQKLPENPAGYFYLCGNQDMIVDARTLLLQKKVDPRKIRFEVFFR